MIEQILTAIFSFAGLVYMIKYLDKYKDIKGTIANKIHNSGWSLWVFFALFILFGIVNGSFLEFF